MCIMIDYCECVFFFKQKTAYEMRISDWSSDVCSSDLGRDDGPSRQRRRCGDEPASGPRRAAQSPRQRQLGRGARRYVGTPPARTGAADERSDGARSEERRVGKECVSTCRSRRSPSTSQKQITTTINQEKHKDIT